MSTNGHGNGETPQDPGRQQSEEEQQRALQQAQDAVEEVGGVEEWATKPWRRAFIATMTRTANISASCRAAGVSRETVHKDMREEPAFKSAVERSREIGYDLIEQVIFRRATVGYQKTKRKSILLPSGQLQVVEEEVQDVVSDVLAMFILNGGRPEKYRQHVKHEHGGAGGEGPVQIEVVRQRTPERFAELLEIAHELGWQPPAELPPGEHPVIEGNGTPQNGDAPSANGDTPHDEPDA